MKTSQMEELDKKILSLLDSSQVMILGTSVGDNPSAANVFFANDGFDLYFFTFNPTRKAEQIRVNPKVQCVVRPEDDSGVRELQIEGRARQLTDPVEVERVKEMILEVTDLFSPYMDDEFLKKNRVTGYYRVVPEVIKLVDFYADQQFQWREFPENCESLIKSVVGTLYRRLGLYLRAVRAPFFTATLAPVVLGGAVAAFNFGTLHWPLFWWSLLGGILVHAGINLANDYSDHVTGNDEANKLFSPFNGGSRMIQAGLFSPHRIFLFSVLMFLGAIAVGLNINLILFGSALALSPLIWIGAGGMALGIFYSAAPFRLSYHGWGDLAVMLGFGPVIALGTHYVQHQALFARTGWDFYPVLAASLPVAILVGLILFINGFQDFEADRKTGKRTWVVRMADFGEYADYRRPFTVYKRSLYAAFLSIAVLGIIGILNTAFSTPWVLIALLPFFLARKAIDMGEEWLRRWDQEGADHQRLPYELLAVNASTIGVHLAVGLLLSMGYWLGALL
ncbi:MAG: UbiA family prenyltransferase [Arenicellales bacterium]|nr:UbiA family prenyltransferase [Arenicellales bacterium]MDP6672548.1 UbiA family prenyltransferase [Arenicellales bacterium]MDP6725012.1 UbiA family prenyltransferase [Arenicellales bacterium]